MKYRFINTFEPVVPLYQDVFARLRESGDRVCVILSASAYRSGSEKGLGNLADETVRIAGSGNKRLSAILFALIAPFYLLRGRAVNVILSQPPLFYIFAALISRLRGQQYVLHIMDMYPELLACSGLSGKILAIILAGPSRWARQSAARIIAIGDCMRDRLIDEGLDREKVFVVRNWADSSIGPVSRENNLFLTRHGLEHDFVVMYSGNMGYVHDIELFLQVAKGLESLERIKFIFLGGGVKRNKVERAIADGARNILLLDLEPRDNLSQSLSAAHIHLVSLRSGYEGLVVPSKFYGVMAAGRPIIYVGDRSGEISRCIRRHQCGTILQSASKVELTRIIVEYFHDPELVQTQGNNARSAYQSFYSGAHSVGQYVKILTGFVPGELDGGATE